MVWMFVDQDSYTVGVFRTKKEMLDKLTQYVNDICKTEKAYTPHDVCDSIVVFKTEFGKIFNLVCKNAKSIVANECYFKLELK